MSDWFATLDGLHRHAWDLLQAGVSDPAHPARLPVLATVDPDASPRARLVVLRRANPGAAEIDIHTDALSAKVGELAASPRAALTVWVPYALLQIRLSLHVTVLTGGAVDPLWDALPEAARNNYGGMPPPGRPIPQPENHAPGADPARFAVLRGRVMQIDLVHLDPERHRRAFYDRSDDFAGRWLAP